MAERLSISIPQHRSYHTAAGFVFDPLGELPQIGQGFRHGWLFEIVDLDGRRIDKILAKRIPPRHSTTSRTLIKKREHRVWKMCLNAN
jgi:putative hemolysin